MIEIYVHIQRINDLLRGKPVNVKVNYADQYDIRMLINPKRYLILVNKDSSNILTIKKKSILDYFRINKNS